jgi:hypothetical protein
MWTIIEGRSLGGHDVTVEDALAAQRVAMASTLCSAVPRKHAARRVAGLRRRL